MSLHVVQHGPLTAEFVNDRPWTSEGSLQFLAVLAQQVGQYAPDATIDVHKTTPARTAVSAPVVAVGEPARIDTAEAVRAGTNFVAVTA